MSNIYTPKRFYLGQPGTTETTLYTAVNSLIAKEIVLTNTTDVTADISLSIVPSGGVAGNDNRIIKNLSIAANEYTIINLSQVLNPSDFFSAIQTTASAINVFISGVEIE